MRTDAAEELRALRRVLPAEYERRVRAALLATGGNITRAAQRLGIARSTLIRLLAEDRARFADLPRARPGRPTAR
jgi:DNA-binding NtrC family response regulator